MTLNADTLATVLPTLSDEECFAAIIHVSRQTDPPTDVHALNGVKDFVETRGALRLRGVFPNSRQHALVEEWLQKYPPEHFA